MLRKESIVLSQQMITFYLAMISILGERFKERLGLSYNDFTLLSALSECESGVGMRPLCEYVMLSRNTILPALTRLEDAGYVVKETQPDDSRYALCHLRATAEPLVRAEVHEANLFLSHTFLRQLPTEEYELLTRGIKCSNDLMRGKSVAQFAETGRKAQMLTDYMIGFRCFIRHSEKRIKATSPLSLSEYRILKTLCECDELSPSNLAAMLCMQRSNVTLYKNKLKQRGLIMEKGVAEDRRQIVLQPSHQAFSALGPIDEALGDLVRLWHSPFENDLIDVLNVWYMRFYSNLRRYLDGK